MNWLRTRFYQSNEIDFLPSGAVIKLLKQRPGAFQERFAYFHALDQTTFRAFAACSPIT